MQDQFRQEARAALLSLLTGAAEESGATLRDIAARLGQGVTSCRTWAKLGSIACLIVTFMHPRLTPQTILS